MKVSKIPWKQVKVYLRFNGELQGDMRISALHCLRSGPWGYFGLTAIASEGKTKRILLPTEISFDDLPPNPGGFQEMSTEQSRPTVDLNKPRKQG